LGKLEGIFTSEGIGLNLISGHEDGGNCPWTLRIGNDEVMRRLYNATGLEGKKHKGLFLPEYIWSSSRQEEWYDLVNIHLSGQRSGGIGKRSGGRMIQRTSCRESGCNEAYRSL